ncbi:MAG TPA: cytochrome c biogenesis protein CcsA [Gammaproteobacteria bacterium]|nr:cytochrome c biogenesis protein CcsA [Gammaproteobacteria bacterium]
MSPALPSVAALVLYLIAASRQARVMALPYGWAGAAVVLHGLGLWRGIHTDAGINLGIFNSASLVMFIIAVILIAMSIYRPVGGLALIVFPAAALTILLDVIFTSQRLLPPDTPPGVSVHIVLSLLAYSVLAIAALEAVLLAVADHLLRQHRPHQVLLALPPLATMESLLFQLLAGGLFLLSLGLISGFMFVENLMAQHLVHKTVLSLLAWCVFALLLWGRYQRGWRGRIAVNYTLGGFALLALAFFGSEFVLQLILHRV